MFLLGWGVDLRRFVCCYLVCSCSSCRTYSVTGCLSHGVLARRWESGVWQRWCFGCVAFVLLVALLGAALPLATAPAVLTVLAVHVFTVLVLTVLVLVVVRR